MADEQKTAATFSQHRQYLFAVAYRLLGIAEDAEDLVQEAWLRFSRVQDTTIDHPCPG